MACKRPSSLCTKGCAWKMLARLGLSNVKSMDNKHEVGWLFGDLCCHTTMNTYKHNNPIKTKKICLLLISSMVRPPLTINGFRITLVRLLIVPPPNQQVPNSTIWVCMKVKTGKKEPSNVWIVLKNYFFNF
jgi:hypothetical protein